MAGTAGCRLLQASGPVHCRPPPRLVFYGCGWWALLNLLVEHSDMRIFFVCNDIRPNENSFEFLIL